MTSELQPQPVGVILQEQDQEGGLQLGRFISAIKRNILLTIGVVTLTSTGAVLKAVTDTPVYQASFELLTPTTTLETQIISTLNEDALSNSTDIVNVAVDETKLKILKSPRVMTPIVERIQEEYPDVGYKKIVNTLRIDHDSQGNTLTISYRDNDPEQVLFTLDVVSEAYLRFSLEDRQNDIFRGIDFVDEQLPVVRDRVEELSESLEALRQSSNLIDPLVQGEQLSSQTAQFTAEQLELRVQIREAQTLYENLQTELDQGEELAASSILLENARYQELLDQLLSIDSQLAEELTLYLQDSPEIEVIEEQRRNLQPLLEREGFRVQRQLASYITELQDRDRALGETIESLNRRVRDLSSTAREYNKIQRELEIATTNLNQFLTKREALRIDAAQRQTPWEVLVPPDTPRASVASARTNLMLGAVLGVFLGVGLSILVDRLGGKIHTVEELKETARIPLLGTIPYEQLLEHEQSLALSLNQLSQIGLNLGMLLPFAQDRVGAEASEASPFMEAFRILATNLQLSSPDAPIKTLSISSAIPNMGKSTITFHLASAMAATGKSVLIVDTDLRRPTIHKLCNIPNERGLSTYASGQDELSDIAINLPINENLYVLPSGPVPPEPMAILTSQRVQDLLKSIHEKFDLVIFDTPPLLGFADAFIMAAKTQGVLLVARLGELKFSQLQSAMDELSIAKIPTVGMVANGVKQDSETAYSYYEYYRSKGNSKNGHHDHTGNGHGQPTWYKVPLNVVTKVSKTLTRKR
ncbi:MAG: polysaccharide biosynthesis tyrosine autokinase [Cyanobacteria bacterium P01_H01_bin.58]